MKKPSLKGMQNTKYLGHFAQDKYIQMGHNDVKEDKSVNQSSDVGRNVMMQELMDYSSGNKDWHKEKYKEADKALSEAKEARRIEKRLSDNKEFKRFKKLKGINSDEDVKLYRDLKKENKESSEYYRKSAREFSKKSGTPIRSWSKLKKIYKDY